MTRASCNRPGIVPLGLALASLASCSGGGGGGGGGGGDVAVIPFVDFEAAEVIGLPLAQSSSGLDADWNEDGRADVLRIVSAIPVERAEIHLADTRGLPMPFSTVLHEPGFAAPFLLADFDGDSHVDFLAREDGSDGAGILMRGDGAGRLADPVAIGPLASAAAAADFDEDGHLDLATRVEVFPGDVGIRFGDGTGGFGDIVPLGVDLSPSLLRAADLNGDGHADLVVSHSELNLGNSFTIVGDGSGAFEIASLVGGRYLDVDLADFDGDGDLDIAGCAFFLDSRSRPFGSREVRINDGAARGWEASWRIATPTFPPLVAADWTGDGRPDLFVADAILVGDGEGGFSEEIVPEGLLGLSGSILGADFDGDGRLDLMRSAASSFRLLRGRDGTGLRVARTISLEADPISSAAGDVDGDGLTDVISLAEDGALVPLFNDDRVGLVAGAAIDVGLHATAIAAADLNGDGRLDVVLARADPLAVETWAGNGSGSFARIASSPVEGCASAIVLSDVDSDGDADAILTLAEEGAISVVLGNGRGSFSRERVAPAIPHPTSLVVASLDGGPRNDDIAVGGFCGVSVLSRLANGSWSAPRFFDLGGDVVSLAATDFDGDGLSDLVCAVRAIDGAGSTVVLLQRDDGAFEPSIAPLPYPGDEPTSVVALDLNGDARPDLAVLSRSTQLLTVAIGDGLGGVVAENRFGTRPSPAHLLAVRFDADALLDLIVIGAAGGSAAVFVNATNE